MKKKILIVVGLLVAVLVVGVLVALAYLGPLIKKGVETVGPMVTKVDVKLDSAQVSLLGGSGSLKGLTVGNPAGYKSPDAIKLGEASLTVVPSTVFGDKIHVKSIAIVAPEITLEGGLKDNNLTKILANVQEFSGPASTNQTPSASSQKKLQVDSVVLSGAKVTASLDVLGNKPLTLTLPDIQLTNLGQGPDGITAGDLTARVLDQVINKTLASVTEAATQAGKQMLDSAVNEATKGELKDATKAVQGVTDLFKKKK